MKKIAITTGDLDGIGLEVSAKALCKIGPQPSIRFFLWRSQSAPYLQLKKMKKTFFCVEVRSLKEALLVPLINKKTLVEIVSPESPAKWVETVALACLKKKLTAMTTAPLSKQIIFASAMNDLGHTDILKRVCKKSSAHMGFIGKHFNVVLATGHIPIMKVPERLTAKALFSALLAADKLRQQLGSSLPLALLGLNPHAGDGGLIGNEELSVFSSVLKKACAHGLRVNGPLVPDAAFHKSHWKKFSVFVCCYHDQGLIPFKTIHGFDSGVHLTLGLPIKRTSVDHGTAKDIFAKNIANPNSMIAALRWAMK